MSLTALLQDGTKTHGDTPRVCPCCGDAVDAAVCPADGEATVALSPFAGLPWLPGAVLAGRFVVESVLGRGGQSVVLGVRHAISGQLLALKLLHAIDDAKLIRRFRRESQALAHLRHAATVRVLDAGHLEDGTPYLAMERLRGRTLEAELRARGAVNPMTEAQATSLAVAVLGCLHEAHLAGLVHRDIKPANLFVCGESAGETYKVLDFGVARQAGSTTQTSHAVGTPAYMSPEQCTGSQVDGRADIYALSVVLYRCVSGTMPYGSGDGHLAMYAHVHQLPRQLSDVAPLPLTPRFVACIMRGLSKAPEDRFSTAADMALALTSEDCSAPTPTAQEQLPVLAPPSTKSMRRWPQAVAGAVAVLALVALAAARSPGRDGKPAVPPSSAQAAHAPESAAPPEPADLVDTQRKLQPANAPAALPSAVSATATVRVEAAPASLAAAVPTDQRHKKSTRPAGDRPRQRPTTIDPGTVLPQE